VERAAAPEHDGGGEHKRDPLPASEAGGRDHREDDEWERERRREDEAAADTRRGSPLDGLERGAVARLLDRVDEVLDAEAPAVVAHCRLLGREVDSCRDAVEVVQPALDAGRAGGARHALDVEHGTAHVSNSIPLRGI
jgi:hypothetical protein